MNKKQITLATWLRSATAAQKKAAARKLKISVQGLYGAAKGVVSAERAARIERAIPALRREALCATCRRCPHAR